MLTYEVDPMVLRPFVPAGTELDHWEGSTFASVVGLLHRTTRVCGIPLPLPSESEEVHLRFYVRRKLGDEWRRGITLVRGIVPRAMIAWIARRASAWKYDAHRMRHRRRRESERDDAVHRLRYEWLQGGEWNRLTIRTEGSGAVPEPGSLEEFITRRGWGYSRRADGATFEFRIERPEWKIWRSSRARLVCRIDQVFGSRFADNLSSQPRSAVFSEGSEVTIHRPLQIAGP